MLEMWYEWLEPKNIKFGGLGTRESQEQEIRMK